MEPASYSYRSLRKAFTKARADHKEEVVELLQRLTGDAFTEQLGTRFALGWGNRFEKQALDFIPVMLACGASSGEALDHLLSTRVMRQGKVTGRYNVGIEAVRNLRGALEDFWVEVARRLHSLDFEAMILLRQRHDMSTIIRLVSQFISGFVMVGCTDEPHVLWNQDLSPFAQHGGRIGKRRFG
jgi:hypothetical protein